MGSGSGDNNGQLVAEKTIPLFYLTKLIGKIRGLYYPGSNGYRNLQGFSMSTFDR